MLAYHTGSKDVTVYIHGLQTLSSVTAFLDTVPHSGILTYTLFLNV